MLYSNIAVYSYRAWKQIMEAICNYRVVCLWTAFGKWTCSKMINKKI